MRVVILSIGAVVALLLIATVMLKITTSDPPESQGDQRLSSQDLSQSTAVISRTQGQSARITPQPLNIPLLELAKGWTWRRDSTYLVAEGLVRNISDRSLKNVMAVVTFLTDEGTFVKSGEALIEYNPVLPGQGSPFKVTTTGNPAITKARVEFKELGSGAIRFRPET